MTELQNKTYTINIGTDDFKEIATGNDLFVDKTSFISTLLGSGYKVTLITRPRRWGKTLNMTMLEYFFGISVHKDGTINEQEQSKKRDVFAQLEIGAHPDILETYLGKFPVIFVSFKEIKGKNYEEIENGVRELIYEVFATHEYLLQSENLSERQKNLFHKFIEEDFDLAKLTSSLFHLSEMLHTHFGQKVIILIDEYDTPLNDWYSLQLARDTFGSEEDAYFQDVLRLFRGIFSKALKGNKHLEKSVVTGILRVAKANLFSGLNNFGEDSILDKKYAPHFGFTEAEVNTLLHKSALDKNPKTAQTLKSWYNGYNIGGLTIYNPWSIMNCLENNGEFKAYWVGTASTALIEQALVLDKFQEEMQILIDGGNVEMIADPKMVFSDIKSSPNALYNLLLFSGYLTTNSIENAKAGMYRCAVRIPNKEIQEVFEVSSMDWITQKLKIDMNEYNAFLDDLLKGNIDAFTQKIKDYLEISASFFATGPKNAELFYNGFILGLVSAVSAQYFVETERESGSGRADLMLIPKNTAKYQNALILEFKFSKSEENLHLLAEQALNQIESKNYKAKIKAHENVVRTLKVGIVFAGKNVEVSFRE
ncbi:MAG TPA: AAA family ATPase [Alphaproteobacteria bacterium]|nr:AAA family ATPase [Alphaproteobacteria bacterium]HQS94757.1 AAA family ATPase [Alphaproteobacteria bacterium]